MTAIRLPAHVSSRSYNAAIKAYVKLLGADNVITHADQLVGYGKIMEPDADRNHRPIGALVVSSVEDIQGVLAICNQYKLPVWPISTGKNLGYGTAAPATPGQFILDMRKMNKIIDFDREMGTALIEPGVTYPQLIEYMEANKLPFWTSFPSSGLMAGPVGNTLDRGIGYNRYGENFSHFCGLEVVLANGEVVRTATGGVENSKTWQNYRWGFGPWVDGLFSQSNFGIVTKMGIWLQPVPPKVKTFMVSWNDDEGLARGIDVTRQLRLQGVIETGLVGHAFYGMAAAVRRDTIYAGKGAIPRDQIKKICNDAGMDIWLFMATLYGDDDRIAADWKAVQAAYAPTGGKITSQDQGLKKGTALEHWHAHMTGRPDASEFGLYNYRGGGGSAWFAPVVQARGSDAIHQLSLIRPILDEYGFEYVGGFLIAERHMEHVMDVLFNRDDPAEARRAHECFSKLIAVMGENGYGVYRTNTGFMAQAAKVYGKEQHALNLTLKHALDPNNVIAPGKSGIMG